MAVWWFSPCRVLQADLMLSRRLARRGPIFQSRGGNVASQVHSVRPKTMRSWDIGGGGGIMDTRPVPVAGQTK
jgi:hypothetical protein